MYLTTAVSKVAALDAENGHERWKYDPYEGLKIKQPRASGGVNRGVAYWSDGRQARIFLGASDGRLISLDANTGVPDSAFGKVGTVDLRDGMDVDLNGLNYGPTSAPAVYRDIVILGFSCPEGGRPAPGDQHRCGCDRLRCACGDLGAPASRCRTTRAHLRPVGSGQRGR